MNENREGVFFFLRKIESISNKVESILRKGSYHSELHFLHLTT